MNSHNVHQPTPKPVSFLPGVYRVHFSTGDRDGPFYFDVEVKKGCFGRAYVRAVGDPVTDGVRGYFLGKWIYTDALIVGQRPVFHGKYQMQHSVKAIEPIVKP